MKYDYDDTQGKDNERKKKLKYKEIKLVIWEKKINFSEKIMMTREINKWNLKIKNEKEKHTNARNTLHFTIESNRNNSLLYS